MNETQVQPVERVTAQRVDDVAAVIERVVTAGDLSRLTATERVTYYAEVCRSVGLNPLTMPFQYITLNGRLVLYAGKGATDQLRRVHHVNLTITSREQVGDVYVVTARASMPDGRQDESVGAVSIAGQKGDALANSLMRAETKAKRRATLSIVGLGMIDESETDTIAGATYPQFNDPQVQDDRPDEHHLTDDEQHTLVDAIVAECAAAQNVDDLRLAYIAAKRAGKLNDDDVSGALMRARLRLEIP